MSEASPFLAAAITITFAVLSLSLLLSFVRLARGPSLPDRIVALEMITMLAVAFIALYVVASGQPAFLEAAIALGLIAFLASIAFARYLERDRGVHE
jgi:multicomponent Na+:H+ antiporter subunit F